MLLGERPVGLAQVELHLGGHHWAVAERFAPLDLAGQRRARRYRVRLMGRIEAVREHQRIAIAVTEQAQRAQVGNQMRVQEALRHVDVGAVDEVVVQVEYVDGVGEMAAALGDRAQEMVHREALAAQVPVGVDDGHLDGVHIGKAQSLLDGGDAARGGLH